MSLVVCNKCGQTVEYASHIKSGFGYGSTFDMETWEMFVCDECMKELVNTFAIAPKGFMVDNYSPNLTPEQHQKTFDNWKSTGKWEEMMFLPYDELISYRDYYEDEYINNCIRKFHSDKPILK